MEASSPLAAMQPTSFLPAWGNDHFTSHPHAHFSSNGYGASAFDFRDISMRHSSKSKPDYFQMKPVRGSSPTASLAADLSQNFHIDMRYVHVNLYLIQYFTNTSNSPQLPTPRRSLFTSNLFGTFDGRRKSILFLCSGNIDLVQNLLRHLLSHHLRPLQLYTNGWIFHHYHTSRLSLQPSIPLHLQYIRRQSQCHPHLPELHSQRHPGKKLSRITHSRIRDMTDI